ncbi:PAS domain S-box protein [candidate division KSB1 bacterium]|nr:PAS domain S-box protein [candidate division KSB1 bacterium]
MQYKKHAPKKSIEGFDGGGKSEPLYRELFENAPIGIYQSTPDGMILLANAILVHMMGYASFDELSHLNLESDWYHPDYPRSNFKAYLEEEDQIVGYESIWMKKDGTPIYVRENARLVRDKEGNALYYEGSVEDITKQKQTEEILNNERKLLHALMDNIPDTIYYKDTESRFTRINKAQAHALGVANPEEAVGKMDFDFFNKTLARNAYADEQKIMKTGQSLIGKLEKIKMADGQYHWVTASKVPLKDQKGRITGLVGISRDVTKEVRAEGNLKQVMRELKRSNAELEQFAYVASHDLQEPLRTVSSYVALLARRYQDKLDTDAMEFIDFALDGTARMRILIQDLLNYSRVTTEAKPFESIDAEHILKAALDNLSITLNESGTEVTHSYLPTILADQGQLIRLFQNLIGNAIKYNQNQPKIHISSEKKDNQWIFAFKDNGIGIDPQYQDKIFGIFKRLHGRDEYSGTGIGLAVGKKIVERHGGTLWIESEGEGKGCTFRFTVPES